MYQWVGGRDLRQKISHKRSRASPFKDLTRLWKTRPDTPRQLTTQWSNRNQCDYPQINSLTPSRRAGPHQKTWRNSENLKPFWKTWRTGQNCSGTRLPFEQYRGARARRSRKFWLELETLRSFGSGSASRSETGISYLKSFSPQGHYKFQSW
jgi:hypothetical protein